MKIALKPWTVPLALLLFALMSFGLLIPQQGFYWDDWPSLLIDQLQGPEGFRTFFSLDRPTTYLSYVALMPILGTDPVRWQIFSLLLRWLTGVCLWWFIREIWPDARQMAVWAALLFVVSPLFKQQPIALTYHQLWMEYLFYMVSLAAMVAAVRASTQKRIRYGLFTLLALSGLSFNFLISEYFIGIELLRPFILWLVIRTDSKYPFFRRQIKAAFLHWLPYLLVFIGYLAWRFFFLQLPTEDRNSPTLLLDLLSSPLQTALRLSQMALQDTVHILVSSWYDTFKPAIFNFETRFNLFSLGMGLLVGILLAAYLFMLRQQKDANQQPSAPGDCFRDAQWFMLLGLLLVFLGPLPGWVTGRQATVGAYSDRLIVPAMFGACLFLSGLIFWLIRSFPQQVAVVCLLVGLASGYNLQLANDYRWARIDQNRFFWQLYWRAPAIEPNTAVFAYAEVLPKTGLYSTAAGINLIYADPSPSGKLPYWFFSLSREFGHRMYDLAANTDISTQFRHFTYQGKSQNSLIVFYDPGKANCLRLVTPKDLDDPALQPVVVEAAPIINFSRIDSSAPRPAPSSDIFGPEPEHGWCYIFQKADLARQNGDWQQVAALGDEASEQGFSLQNSSSNTAQEWIPFIEGYAHTNRWEEAQSITLASLEREPKLGNRLCEVWQDIRDISDDEGVENSRMMLQKLGCETAASLP